MKITPEKIEAMPALLESDYSEFRARIRETLADALENGDAVKSMQTILGDFMRALNHTLEEYDAPKTTLGKVTEIL